MTPWTTTHQASLSFTLPWGWSNSCPLSWWCHPTILSSVAPFCSCPQSLPTSGSFPISQLFASGSQSIGASATVFPMNIQVWLVWSCNPGTLKSLLYHHISALWQPREVGWGGKWKGDSRGRGKMYIYGWFMSMYGRNQHNIVKQLSSNVKINKNYIGLTLDTFVKRK